jgi:hypothetical protein
MDCDNAEVANNSALVITKLVIEYDSRDTGAYARCNICVNGSDHHGNNSCTDGVYDCTCEGSAGCTNAVGVQNLTSFFGGHACKPGDPTWECWHDATCRKTGGMWYSTTDEGYCGDGSKPAPANCTWRVAEFVKRVNKTCSDNVSSFLFVVVGGGGVFAFVCMPCDVPDTHNSHATPVCVCVCVCGGGGGSTVYVRDVHACAHSYTRTNNARA